MIQPKRLFELLAAFLFIIILFSSLKTANHFYPYYLSWDMDLTTAIDLLIVQAERIHVHFAHPATGMLMILKPIHYIAHWLGYVDTLTLSDLAKAHNPSLAMAQLTDFARSVSPFIITAVALFLSCVVMILGPNSSLFRLLTVGLIFSSYWVIQEATFIRTETFAWFYLSLACVFAALAAKTDSIKLKPLFLIILGVFVGMTYYTKIQSLTTLSLPVILFFIFDNGGLPQQHNYFKKMSTATFCLFLLLVVVSFFYGFPPDTYIEHFREHVAITVHGLLIGGTITYLCWIHYKASKFSLRWQSYLTLAVPITLGFVLSFFIPLIQYASISRSVELVLINFQSVVMTKIYTGLSHQIAPRPMKVLGVLIASLPITLPLLATYFMFYFSRSKEALFNKVKWGLALLIGLIFFNLIFVVRDAARHDIIWYESLSCLVILLSLSYLWKENKLLKWSAIAVVCGMIGINFVNTNLAYANSQFSYGEERPFLKQSYPGQRDYTAIFNERTAGLNEDMAWQFSSQHLNQARDHRKIDYFLRFHFTNLKPDIRWVSSAKKGWQILDSSWHVSHVSESLNGQNLLDLTSAVNNTPPPKAYHQYLSYLLVESQFARKWVDPREKIYLRIQNDITSQILIDPSQNTDIDCKQITQELWIEIKNTENKNMRLQSFYCENGIPYKSLKGPVFAIMLFNNP